MARIYKLTSYIIDKDNERGRDISSEIDADIFHAPFEDQVVIVDSEVVAGPEFEWNRKCPLFDYWHLSKDNYEEWFNKKNEEPCECYEERVRKAPRYDVFTGKINYYIDEPYSICLGTKECDECHCGGWKSRCERNT